MAHSSEYVMAVSENCQTFVLNLCSEYRLFWWHRTGKLVKSIEHCAPTDSDMMSRNS